MTIAFAFLVYSCIFAFIYTDITLLKKIKSQRKTGSSNIPIESKESSLSAHVITSMVLSILYGSGNFDRHTPHTEG